ncbi:hypothetical protein FZEAL_7258, partial [Fusarium zealandicum]
MRARSSRSPGLAPAFNSRQQGSYVSSNVTKQRVIHHPPLSPHRTNWTASDVRPSTASSYQSTYSPFPPPSRPLPPIPRGGGARRVSSQDSLGASSFGSNRFSQSSIATSVPDRSSVRSPYREKQASSRYSGILEEEKEKRRRVAVTFSKAFDSEKKKKAATVHYLNLSKSACLLSSKHGKNIVKVWSVSEGIVLATIKFVAYTEPQSRCRDYLIRSHAIISEAASLIVVATRFGRTLEIWNWTDKKNLQTIELADRWASGSSESSINDRSVLATYHNETHSVDLYAFAQDKKPLHRIRSINLREADLPFLMQFPELAISSTSPLLVAAAGPRPPRPGYPPPAREVLLIAWKIDQEQDGSSAPYLMTRAEDHRELETAIPCELATYGSVVVSIWIPASFQIRPEPGEGGTRYNFFPV